MSHESEIREIVRTFPIGSEFDTSEVLDLFAPFMRASTRHDMVSTTCRMLNRIREDGHIKCIRPARGPIPTVWRRIA